MSNNHQPRTIAIGDIHGCSAALTSLLRVIDPQPADTIITLGDYINRGPDTRGVIEQLIALAQLCQLVPLLGNHDAVLLDVIEGRAPLGRLLAMGGDATFTSYGPESTVESIPKTHVEFLRSCRLFHETETHLFVHANYAPNLPLDQTSSQTLLWLSLRESVPAQHLSGRIAIVGHTPQDTGRPLDLGHLVCIDTGCVYGGRLTAMDVGQNRIWQVAQDGLTN